MASLTRIAASLLPLLASLLASVAAFEVTFPSATSYWVSCKENTLQWTTNTTDPVIFSVALLNHNKTLLNGNYQVANSVRSSIGTISVQPNCLPPGDGYFLNFVNASNYALDHPQVFYTSPTFTIKSNKTEVLKATNETSAPVDAPSDPSVNRAANPNKETMDASKMAKDGAQGLQAAAIAVALAVLAASVATLV